MMAMTDESRTPAPSVTTAETATMPPTIHPGAGVVSVITGPSLSMKKMSWTSVRLLLLFTAATVSSCSPNRGGVWASKSMVPRNVSGMPEGSRVTGMLPTIAVGGPTRPKGSLAITSMVSWRL